MNIPKTETVVRVSHPQRETPFLVSFMRGPHSGFMVVKGYEVGDKRPPVSKHLLFTAPVRNWIEELVECPETETASLTLCP